MPTDARARRNEHAQLGACEFTATHEEHRTTVQIEKYRQGAHVTLAAPAPGLTGIIFYICLVQRSQRENFFFCVALQLWNFRLPTQRAATCIFSTGTSPRTRRGKQGGRKHLPYCKFQPIRSRSITSTHWRRKVSTSCARRLRV